MTEPFNLDAVFSRRPDEIGAEQYDAWYHDHVIENLAARGFVGAERYAVRCSKGPDGIQGSERHLALYRYTGPSSVWREDLKQRIAGGTVQLPPWFSGIEFTSWECTPVSGWYEATHDDR